MGSCRLKSLCTLWRTWDYVDTRYFNMQTMSGTCTTLSGILPSEDSIAYLKYVPRYLVPTRFSIGCNTCQHVSLYFHVPNCRLYNHLTLRHLGRVPFLLMVALQQSKSTCLGMFKNTERHRIDHMSRKRNELFP